jgi:N-acetylmuramoyl-L-alanine amidase
MGAEELASDMKSESTSTLAERKRNHKWLTFAGVFVFVATACSGKSDRTADAGVDDFAQGRALLATADLPARANVLSVAQAVEAAADQEGGGARAVELHALAGQLFERMWRLEGKEQDAKEAIETLQSAAHDPRFAGACDASIRAAQIAGELGRDASITYRELYRAERRFSLRSADAGVVSDASTDGASCNRSIDAKLAKISPFRPPARILDAIDQELAKTGTLGIDTSFDAGVTQTGAPHITEIVPIGGKDSARIVVTLDREAQMRVGDEPATADHGSRTFVDLDGVDVSSAPRETLVGGIVTRVLIDATSTGGRITTELDGRGYRRTFHLLEPYRIVIDVARRPPGETGRNVRIVALDAGHGGSDPGAIGPTGVREKDVTLAIAQLAAKALARDGVATVLTRDTDRYVSLEERTARANAAGADLFISIHCNAAERPTKRGVETYVLDTTKDETASRVAARENATTQAATREIGSILASMKIADEATHSQRFADLIEHSAVTSLKLRYADTVDGGVKNAGFYVLVGARMPAVLFETSYISNPLEEQLLSSDEYKARLSDGIVNAVKAYREGR